MESALPGWEDARAARGGVATRDDAHLARLVRDFEDAEEASADAREKAERDRDYYDGKQLTSEEERELQRRGQPVIVVNRTKRKIDYLLGHERASRTDPKAYPRTMNDEGAAEAATDALRYVCDAQRFDVKRSSVWENLLIEGFGGVEVGAEVNARGEPEPVITHVSWDRIFYDPHSKRPDFSDAKYLGTVAWMDQEDAVDKWPEAEAAFIAMMDSSLSDTYDDRPSSTAWADGRRRRIRIVQMYYRKSGVWYSCIFTKGGMLRPSQPVEYVNEDGEPDCPLILQSAYIDRDNNRYGVVREMIGPQDEVNKRRSKALHLLSVRQTIGEQGAVADVAAMKREMAKPDGHIEIAPGMRFEVSDTTDLATGQVTLLQEAKAEIDLIGPNAAMTGKDDKAPSGRAILASQQGGNIELGPLTDALRQWQWRVYRAIWCRIKQYWTAEKWVRVTDDEDNLKWVPLNKPVTLDEKLQTDPEAMNRVQAIRQNLEQTNPMMVPQFEQELRANLGQVVDIQNDLARMDIDINLQDAPDTVTLQAEQFDQLVQLATAMPGLIPPDALIEASALRSETKKRITDRMEQQQAAPPPDPMAQQAQQLVLAKGEAEVRKLHAEAGRAELDGQAKMLQAQRPEPMPAPGPAPDVPTPLDQQEQLANIELKHAQAYKAMRDADRPPPQPAMRPAPRPAAPARA
jgi:hypothetical protein